MNCFAYLPVLDYKSSIPATMMIMDMIAPALFIKGTMEKALRYSNRTIGKTLVHLEEIFA